MCQRCALYAKYLWRKTHILCILLHVEAQKWRGRASAPLFRPKGMEARFARFHQLIVYTRRKSDEVSRCNNYFEVKSKGTLVPI